MKIRKSIALAAGMVMAAGLIQLGKLAIASDEADDYDLGNLSLSQFPPVSSGGQIEATGEIISALGYDPSRSWSAGQTPDTFMMLGDFQEAFQLQKLTLSDIESGVGEDYSNVPLSEYGGILEKQTLASTVEAVPGLKDYTLSEVPVFEEAIANSGYQVTPQMENQTLGSLMGNYEKLGEVSLGEGNLSAHSMEEIPNLDQAQIGDFQQWQESTVSSVPGLSDLQMNYYPSKPSPGGGFGMVDLVFGESEMPADRSISGSDKEGFNVGCASNCAHIEMGGNPIVNGKQWISGKSQEVKGGHGVLAAVCGGKEPTGRHPYGPKFKVAIWDTDETTDEAGTSWFFRICKPFLGCTPYCLGPIPAFSYKVGDYMILGL